MGWRDAPIVKQAPEALQKPVSPTETPGFRGAVAGAEAGAKAGVEARLKPGTEAATAVATADIPTPAIYQELSSAKTQLSSVAKQLDRAEQIYNRSLKGKEPWRVVREYFPGVFPGDTVAKDVGRFNTAASQLYSLASQITRVPGEGAQDMREFAQKLEAFKPSSDDNDEVVEEKLGGLRSIISERLNFVNERLSSVKKPTPNINRTKAMMGGQSAPKVIKFDRFGNRM
jgi:hypothetical protein